MEVPFSAVAEIIRAAFPDASSRRNVGVELRERHYVADYWSEGSRTYVRFVRLHDLRVLPSDALPGEARQQVGNPHGLPIADVLMQPGIGIVEHVIFCGKDLGYRLVLHPANVLPALSEAPKVSERDRKILEVFRSFKSSYRQAELASLGYTQADRDRLAAAGYLKVTKVGVSITSEGRIVSQAR